MQFFIKLLVCSFIIGNTFYGCGNEQGTVGTEVATGCVTEDLVIQCPVGTSPRLEADAESSCGGAASVDYSSVEMSVSGEVSQVCVGEGTCKLVCELDSPCEFGISSLTREEIVCAENSAVACGDGMCSGQETAESCPIDCDRICEPGSTRCNGSETVEICNARGSGWDQTTCGGGEQCASARDGLPARCAPPPRCGDGEINGDESCDNGIDNGSACEYGETSCRVCSESCEIVDGETASCGDGIVNGPQGAEECDEESSSCEYGSENCQTCVDCELIDSEAPRCGDGVINGPEQCDGEWFCGEDCSFSAPCASSEVGCPEIEWVTIEGGEFQMGDLRYTNSSPLKQITFEQDFDLSRSEVTVEQYQHCVLSGECSEPQAAYDYQGQCRWLDPQTYSNHPINCLTWYQMMSFARWVGARLPTEAEWEWAGRSRRQDYVYPWGTDDVSCESARVGYQEGLCEAGTAEVCTHPEGNSEQGLCDMVGNLSELTQDVYTSSLNELNADGSPLSPSGTTNLTGNRSIRGSSWLSYDQQQPVTSRSGWFFPTFPNDAGNIASFLVGDDQSRSAKVGFRLRRLESTETTIGPICGDGIVSADEQCDDGNQTVETCNDGENCLVCTPSCEQILGTPGRCGDGYINRPQEECDGQSFCQADCQLAPCYANPNGCPDIDVIEIEGGILEAGSSTNPQNYYQAWMLPVEEVPIGSMKAARSELTVAQYRACVNAGACTPPNCDESTRYTIWVCNDETAEYPCDRSAVEIPSCNYVLDRDDHPVNYISTEQAQTYAAWAGFQIPTVYEWEYLAKSGGSEARLYPWMEGGLDCSQANYRLLSFGSEGNFNCSRTGTVPVCTTLGLSDQGLCDLLGNVAEWVVSLQGEVNMNRGSSFNTDSFYIRSYFHNPPAGFETSGNALIGVRLIKAPRCGDGIIHQGETCDDGNVVTESCELGNEGCEVCNQHCELVIGENARCGDGHVNEGEVCDGQPFCTRDCEWAPCVTAVNGCPEIKWIEIEGGEFEMGDRRDVPDENEIPIHTVTVPTFKIQRSEITVGQYRLCVNAGECTPPSVGDNKNWSESLGSRENHPVNGVTWRQVMEFASWVGARLPTEAEWEYAARGGGQETIYPWGNQQPNCEIVSFIGCREGTVPVCTLPYGNTPQGVCDMSGNVLEWVQDEWHDDYIGAPTDGSGWCSQDCPNNSEAFNYDANDPTRRAYRGGAWGLSANNIRTATRGSATPATHTAFAGARLAK